MDGSADWTCLICCELSPFKVVGKCNHPICITCSARLRELCEQKYCPVCREDLAKVSCKKYNNYIYTILFYSKSRNLSL